MHKQYDVLTFGETMLRLTPPGSLRLAQSSTLETWVAGSESNFAAGLCALGVSASWVSRLPDNCIGRKIADTLRGCGIQIDNIVWTAPTERVGLFYAESAAPPRPPHVIYDREGSAASGLAPPDLPESLFETHRHLHLTGITPALSPQCAEAAAYAISQARKHNCTVSFDVNYRAKLWTPEQAREALTPLMTGVDLLFCAYDDAGAVFGCDGDSMQRAQQLRETFAVSVVALTAGAEGAVGVDSSGPVGVPALPIAATVDRFGSGDAFAAGVVASYLRDTDAPSALRLGRSTLAAALRLGVAAAIVKRTIPGDILVATRSEIEAILAQQHNSPWR